MSNNSSYSAAHTDLLSSYVTDESEDDSAMEWEDMMDVADDTSHKVRFASSNVVKEIPSRESFSEEEIRAIWYKKDDYQEMKRLALETINLNRSGSLLPGDPEHCMRGLEGRTHDGFTIVKQNRSIASFAVVDEQDRQDEVGINDSDLIAEVYRKCTIPSQCVALAQGIFDAQEVMRELLEESRSTGGTVAEGPSKPAATSQVPVDQNTLLLFINSEESEDINVAADSTVAQQEVDFDFNGEPLNLMEWTAEAA